MSKKQTTIQKKTQTKKHPKHASHKKEFLKVYWPYLPLFVLVFFGMTFGYNWQSGATVTLKPTRGVLAYATDMTIGGLLSGTNTQRSQNGLAGLTLNSSLNNAAQAKANDMVARNYWSHTTPDGKDPWVFIDATGYAYQKAGENLAYGFGTSSETIVGWMNSSSHRANILDSAYKEVGFGIANSASYVGTGEETVVVAMYANPVASTPPPAAPAPVATSTAPQTKPATTVATTPSTQPTQQDTVVPTPEQKQAQKVPDDRYNEPITSDTDIPAAQPATRITKLQSITSGNAPWSAAVLSGILVMTVGIWVIKHAIIVKRVLVDGEKFVLHHPLIDVAVLIVVAAAILLSQSSGVVK
jgi:hypothetical protein